MLLIALLIIVAAIAVASYFLSGKSLVAPAVLFAGGFTLSSLFALLYAGPWGFELHLQTFLVIALGIAWFAIVAIITSKICAHFMQPSIAHAKHARPGGGKVSLAPVHIVPVAIFLVIQIAVFVATLVLIQDLFPDESLTGAIKSFNSESTFSTDAPDLPQWFNHIRMLATGGSYFIAYLVGQQLASGWRKRDFVLAGSALLAVALILETGGRTSAIAYIVVAVVSYFVVRERLYGNGIPWKAVIIVVVIAIVLLATFKFAAVGGRGAENRDPLEYLAMYLGAEIANLDAFLEGAVTLDDEMPNLFGTMTFMRDWNYAGDKLDIEAWIYAPDLPFQYRNGYSLGNVYTVFYAFIYDFGYAGVAVLVAIMSLISQLIFEKAAHARPTRWFSIWTTCYAVLAFALFMSFFSNKFYEDIVSINFVRNLLYILIARYFISYFNPRALAKRFTAWRTRKDSR